MALHSYLNSFFKFFLTWPRKSPHIWNRNNITVFTKACHRCVFQIRWSQSVNFHPISLRHTLIISSHVRKVLSSNPIRSGCLFPYVQHVLPSVALPHYKLPLEYLRAVNRIEARNHGAQSRSASQSPRYPIQTTVRIIRHRPMTMHQTGTAGATLYKAFLFLRR
jgi:hypothetical protein